MCINCVKEQCRRIRFESRLAEDYKFVSDALKSQTSHRYVGYCKTNIGTVTPRFQGRKLIIFRSSEIHNASSNVVFTSKLSCHLCILFLLVCLCVPLPPFPFSLLLRICAFVPKSWSFCLPMTAFLFFWLPWASLPHIFYKWRKIKANKRK